MPKLFEILAVEGDLSGKAQSSINEARNLFGKPDKFIGQTRRYKPLDEDSDPLAPEDTNVAFRVDDVLGDAIKKFGSWVDVSIQKEVTNQSTFAKVVIDNEVLFELPAPALLNLEQKLGMLKSVFEAIPTNDITERWEFDGEQSLFVTPPRTTYRTEKRVDKFVKYDATPEHPAQVELIQRDIRAGEWTTVIRSGMWSPSQKQQVLDRLARLHLAVKQARQRANDIEIVDTKVSGKIVEFLGVALS